MHFDLQSLIQTTGYIGIFIIVFIESGLLLGFFLPGDSLLFTAGFLASQNLFDIYALIFIIFAAAVAGDSVGYSIGRRWGVKIFERKDGRIFNKEHLKKSQEFYNRHGGKTIIIARFVPIVRTFAPVLAGVSHMKYRQFLVFNVIGAAIWSIGVTLLGYFLGQTIPDIDRYLLPIILLVVLLSISPSVIHLLRHPGERRRLLNLVKGKKTKS